MNGFEPRTSLRWFHKGFTLIELLIVVAIIAILAAIAVPNFLEAQTRAKVSRAKTDMRTVSVAIESYAVDHNRPPIGFNEGNNLNIWDADTRHFAYNRFTSPVAYLTSPPMDPFAISQRVYNVSQDRYKPLDHYEYVCYKWRTGTSTQARFYGLGFIWHVRSVGPDKVVGKPYIHQMAVNKDPSNIYDATNGTKSYGAIHLTNKGFFDASQM